MIPFRKKTIFSQLFLSNSSTVIKHGSLRATSSIILKKYIIKATVAKIRFMSEEKYVNCLTRACDEGGCR